MRILIVEDELLLVKHLVKLLADVEPAAQIAGSTNSISATIAWLSTHDKPDLILMDIELADGQSFEIFEKMEVKSPVIFTTAYDEYALKAFKVSSIDYLLKPVKETDLKRALDKLKNLRESGEQPGIQNVLDEMRRMKTSTYRERILVKAGQKMISIPMDDVGMFFTNKSLNYLLTKTKQKYIVDQTLDEIEGSLDPKKFFRANRQHILAHHAINVVHPWFNGKLKVEINLPTEEPVVISRDKASAFKEWLGE
ncbi:MAG TPA: LytTR family DNA-binding domain-containing protein [Parafilimonas sp.]|nr:LytTR family DNA-binding domain-containing protein [Parafilimonas sp.]